MKLTYEERNEEMRWLRGLGWTLHAIGDRYGVSRERVRQLVGDEPTPPPINSYNPFTPKHKRLIRDILQLGVKQSELGVKGFGLAGKHRYDKKASHLNTGFCRTLLYELLNLIVVHAYRDGATVAELDEMFDKAGCGRVWCTTISRLRERGFGLPHRTLGIDWHSTRGHIHDFPEGL